MHVFNNFEQNGLNLAVNIKQMLKGKYNFCVQVSPIAVGCIMPFPEDVHDLIPRTYEYVTLYSNRDCVDVIKLRILKWGDYPELSGRAQCIHKGPCKRDTRGTEIRRCYTAGLEGAMSQGMQAVSTHWKRQRNGFSPRASGRNENPFWTSDLQNSKRINLCCFKSLAWGNLLQLQLETNMPTAFADEINVLLVPQLQQHKSYLTCQ